MIFNIPLLQYVLFEKMSHAFVSKGLHFSAAPTVPPSPSLFPDEDDAEKYLRFVSSTFRVEVGGGLYYFFFRNAKNKLKNNYAFPSSLEIVFVDSNQIKNKIKFHYFSGHQDSILLCQSAPFYATYSCMKDDIKTVVDYVVDKFNSFIDL